jgi:hypothetical protein
MADDDDDDDGDDNAAAAAAAAAAADDDDDGGGDGDGDDDNAAAAAADDDDGGDGDDGDDDNAAAAAAADGGDGDGGGVITCVDQVNANEQREEDVALCIICLEKPKDATIVHGDTAHVCCCFACAKSMKDGGLRCPICRQTIDTVVKHYIA